MKREIYFTTLDVPEHGPIVYMYTIQGFVQVGSLEYLITEEHDISRKVMHISRKGNGSGVIILKENGQTEVIETIKRKSVKGLKMPYPKYKRN